MAIGLNLSAFRSRMVPAIHKAMADLDRLMRTPEGRKQLADEYRARAKGLRDFAARGEFHSHCPWPTAEPYLKKAEELEAAALKYEQMTGSKGLYEK